MKQFKHSGASGDLIYSMALMRHLGGGNLFLHLHQIDWIGRHYYGSAPDPFHQGRMTLDDYEHMRDFVLAQSYVNDFRVLDQSTEITHNLDRFRPLFVGHPGNYVDIYAVAFGIDDPATRAQIRTQPWLTVPTPTLLSGRDVVINRTTRWLPPELDPQWARWRIEGLEQRAVFVGLESEHAAFEQATGWTIPRYATPTLLDLAAVIAGAKLFIGNQSQALALAIGLGTPYWCEARRDLPLTRNECWFPDQPNSHYF